MIKSFADKETELIYNQKFSKRLPNTIQKVALRKLMMIDNAKCLEDLRVPPSNHLEQNHIHVRPLMWSLIGKTMSDFIETPTIGEILSEEFLIPLGISAYKLAQERNLPFPHRISLRIPHKKGASKWITQNKSRQLP